MRRISDHWTKPANEWEALQRVTRTTTALENAMPILQAVMRAGHNSQTFHNLQIELGNLDYVLRQLKPARDPETGEVLHPDDIRRNGGAR